MTNSEKVKQIRNTIVLNLDTILEVSLAHQVELVNRMETNNDKTLLERLA